MIEVGDLWLLRPWWLLGIPLSAMAAFLVLRRHGGLGAWHRVADTRLLTAMAALGHVAGSGGRRAGLVPFAIAACLCLALAGPAVRKPDRPSFENLDAILLVLDLSRSVVLGGNLDDAQAAAAFVLQNARGRPVGLILYDSEPYLVSAPTTDVASLESPIAVLGTDTMPRSASRPEGALAMARELLADAGIVAGDVVLISDGGGLSSAATVEARRIRENGGTVSAIFVKPSAAPPGMPAADPDGLGRVAAAGGGGSHRPGGLSSLADTLVPGAGIERAPAEISALLFDDIGRYLMVLAMLPALLLFRRGAE